MSTDDIDGSTRSRENLLQSEPELLADLIHGSMSAEFAAGRDGKPVAFPMTPFFDRDRESIIVTSPVAYAGKAKAVERDPRVSMLLHDASGEYLLTGNARVNDDVEGNAAYVRALTNGEPPTPKRAANVEKYEFIDSWLGKLLVGWLGKRIVIEIEPAELNRMADTVSIEDLPTWPSVGMERDEAVQYDRAVLTVVDDDGYPVTRPITTIRLTDGAAVLEPESLETVRHGQPACLLLHWHDEASINLTQRMIRGRFKTDDGPVRFVPGGSSTLRSDGYLDTIRFIIDGKRRTRKYLREASRTDAAKDGAETPPGPSAWPVVGNTLQFIRDPFGFYEELPTHGDVVRYRIGWHTWTAILHPDVVERVLVDESHRFRRYNFEDLGFDIISDGLFFTDGEQWRRQRKVIQPAFSPANIAPFAETIVSQTTGLVDEWDDGETIIANHAFSELVLDILTTTLFDLDLDDRRDVVTAAGRALADRADTQSLSAFLPAWIPTPRNRRFNRQMTRFEALVETLIEERRDEDVARNDLLSTLLELTGPMREATGDGSDERTVAGASAGNDSWFTDEELRDQLTTFLFAGHETTALVLTYACLLLAEHDDVRLALEEELAAVCGDRDPTIDDVQSLEFTENVIKETMRYYPPIYVLFREARHDVTVDGYTIPEGTKLALPQFILHSDNRWWEDPHEFRPDRWTDELDDAIPNYAYFPFGGGPRHCVGMRLATVILTLGLASIVRRVKLDLESDPDPDLRMAATLSPASDIEFTVRKRE